MNICVLWRRRRWWWRFQSRRTRSLRKSTLKRLHKSLSLPLMESGLWVFLSHPNLGISDSDKEQTKNYREKNEVKCAKSNWLFWGGEFRERGHVWSSSSQSRGAKNQSTEWKSSGSLTVESLTRDSHKKTYGTRRVGWRRDTQTTPLILPQKEKDLQSNSRQREKKKIVKRRHDDVFLVLSP